MDVDIESNAEDARRLREFSAFDAFSDAELERVVEAAQRISQSVPGL